MARKRITLDQLAAMVANGFDALQREMQEGFRQITGRLEAMGARLSEHVVVLREHTHRLDRIERKLDSTIERVDDHSIRLERPEKQGRG